MNENILREILEKEDRIIKNFIMFNKFSFKYWKILKEDKMKRLIEIIIEKKIIEILLENNYKIHVLSEDLVEINTKELLPNNDLISIYLIYKNETIVLLGKDFYIEKINEFNIIENLKKITNSL